ncbi:hypothetical protein CAEBREN_14226 [Caenorhabditis brenneri]|uniref:Uncharacterized protein n=1 Tax=Caenorhabditis brenneri TaxID=135651 RepID=G0P7D4_CAEBE|nr:hypothetical protein CAEBREN_14226 [Caenorhabditis brenneri]
MKPCSTVLWDLFLQQCSNVLNEWCLSDNPLAYDSLKTVLKYLKPNKRVQLASQIPSIRKIERIVPIRYSQLVFDEWSTTVDDTKRNSTICPDSQQRRRIPLKRLDRAIPTEGDFVLRDDIMQDEVVQDDEWEKETKQKIRRDGRPSTSNNSSASLIKVDQSRNCNAKSVRHKTPTASINSNALKPSVKADQNVLLTEHYQSTWTTKQHN